MEVELLNRIDDHIYKNKGKYHNSRSEFIREACANQLLIQNGILELILRKKGGNV